MVQAQEIIRLVQWSDPLRLHSPLGQQAGQSPAGSAAGSRSRDNNRLVLADPQANSQVTLSRGKLSIDGQVFTAATGNIQTLEVNGGPGTNTFVTDGSIPNVVLVGGKGSTVDTFTATGGNNKLVGAAPVNIFNLVGLVGPGTYNVAGGPGTNTLTIGGDDNGDTIRLSQSGSTITVTGTATKITWMPRGEPGES